MQAIKIDNLYNIARVILHFMRERPYEIVLFWMIGLALILLSGICIVELCGLDEKIELYYMAGCILPISVSHIMASLMELLGKTFSEFRNITLCVYGIIVIVMIIICIKRGRLSIKGLKKHLVDSSNKFKMHSLFEKVLFLAIAVFGCYIMLNTMCRLYEGSDDGYYVVKIGMMIHDNSLHLTNEQVSNGMVHVSSFIRADASTWCTFQACIASIFRIDYAVTAHIAIVPFILVAAMATVSLLAKAMFHSTVSQTFFWISFFLFAFTAPAGGTMTNDYWIFAYPWFGVSTLYIMLYFLIYCLLMLYKREGYLFKTGFWLFVALSVTASMAMEVVAVYLIPCFMLMFGLPYIVINRRRMSISAIFRMSWILLPILQSAIVVLIAYSNMSDHALTLNGGENGGFNMALSSIAAWDAKQAVFWGITSQNIYTILTIICLLCIKDKKTRMFFGWSYVTAITTFLNPLFYKFICVHISTEVVYYRLYWCVPNLVIITYCFIEHLIEMSRNKKRSILVYMVFIAYIVGFRQNVYSNNQSIWSPNMKKVPTQCEGVAEMLLSFRSQDGKIYALVPWHYCDYVRQCSLDIVYPLGKRSPSSGYNIPGSELNYRDLYTKVYSLNEALGELSDADVGILKSLGTQVIVFRDASEIPEVLHTYDDVLDEHGHHYILLQ